MKSRIRYHVVKALHTAGVHRFCRRTWVAQPDPWALVRRDHELYGGRPPVEVHG